jgi:DNA-binding NarL/FixJ family response regulator
VSVRGTAAANSTNPLTPTSATVDLGTLDATGIAARTPATPSAPPAPGVAVGRLVDAVEAVVVEPVDAEPTRGRRRRAGSLTNVDGRTHVANRLVGRDDELRRLRQVVASGDGMRVALVGGEAGIGKTRLIDEALHAAPADALVLRLRGDPGRRSRPFQAYVEAVEPYVRHWTGLPGVLTAREHAISELLAPVVPALEHPSGGESTIETLERAAIDVLRHLAPDTAPVVIAADDLHWTDAETIALVQQLVVGVPGLDDAVVLGSYRPEGLLARSPLSALLAAVERRQDGVNLRLGALDLDDVADVAAQFLGQGVAYRDVKALHHRSGGNPFFLGELLTMAGELGAADVADLPLPWTVAELLRDTVQSLTDSEREVVETAAVLGQRVPFDLLAQVTGLDERDLIDRLRAVVAAGLLVEEEVDLFAFRHALVCESIAGGLLGRERRRLHERALDVLRRADTPDDAAIAHHAQAAGRIDEMLAAVRRAARSAAARGATYHALEFAEMGLAEAPDDPVLCEVAARSAWLVGALDDAREHANRWIVAAVSRGDIAEESRARRVLMRIAWDGGDDETQNVQIERLKEIVDVMEGGADRAALLADLAQAHMLTGRREETVEFADRAIVDAEMFGLEVPRVQALVERWSLCATIESEDMRAESERQLLAAAVEADRLGDHVTAARAYNNAVETVAVDRRRDVIERMRASAERAGFAALSAYSYATQLAELASLSADRSELERWLVDAWRWSRLGHCRKGDGWLRTYEVLLATEASTADHTGVRPFLDRATLEGDADLPTAVGAMFTAARTGSADGARRAMPVAFRATKGSASEQVRNAPLLVEAALRAGLEPAEVRIDLEALVPPKAQSGQGWDVACAFLAAAEGDRAAADAYAARMGNGIEAWLRGELLVQLAELALADDDPVAAAARAETATVLLGRWPGWRRDRAEALRRRLDRRMSSDGDTELSAREQEVAALLADGLTNAQIAERLFIARKTAAVHVSNILAKLGMRSRTEIAAWAVRQGLAPAVERAG